MISGWSPTSDSIIAVCCRLRVRLDIAEIRLDRTLRLQCQRITAAVQGLSDGHADPALADAVFLDIGLLDTLEPNADATAQHGLVIERAGGVVGQAVGRHVGHQDTSRRSGAARYRSLARVSMASLTLADAAEISFQYARSPCPMSSR